MVTEISGTCDGIVLAFGPIHAVVGGRFLLDLEASPLVLGGGRRILRCMIARRAASGAPLFTLAGSLTRLLET